MTFDLKDKPLGIDLHFPLLAKHIESIPEDSCCGSRYDLGSHRKDDSAILRSQPIGGRRYGTGTGEESNACLERGGKEDLRGKVSDVPKELPQDRVLHARKDNGRLRVLLLHPQVYSQSEEASTRASDETKGHAQSQSGMFYL